MFIPADTAAAPPLEDDVRVFDASRLTIHQTADNEVGRSTIAAGIVPLMHADESSLSAASTLGHRWHCVSHYTHASFVFRVSSSSRMLPDAYPVVE